MYGSIGWGVLMFIMGIVLDYSNVWPEAKCQMNPGERNYNVCFFMFALMMFIAFIVATQIQFRYNLNISSSSTAFNTTPVLQIHFVCKTRNSNGEPSEWWTSREGKTCSM